jgi:C-terminal processing protease CtpA/Prc
MAHYISLADATVARLQRCHGSFLSIAQCIHSHAPQSQQLTAIPLLVHSVQVPLALLVDGKTASASEVLTGALKENSRARVVGAGSRSTFGKGVIQTVEPLAGGGGVAVTVARYETPQRHDINGRGIAVDIVAECAPEAAATECVPAAAFEPIAAGAALQ